LVDVVVGDGDDDEVGTFALVVVMIIIAMVIGVVAGVAVSVLRWPMVFLTEFLHNIQGRDQNPR